MSHLSIYTVKVPSHTHNSHGSNNSNNNNNNNSCTNTQCILPPPPLRGVLTTILSIVLMTLTMTIIPTIIINGVVTVVFTPVAAEGGNLDQPYIPYAYPVDCCAYELSGTTEDSFPPLLLLLTDPRDQSERINTYFYPPGSRRVIPRKLNNDTKNANNTDINDGSSDFVPMCNSTNLSIWYGLSDVSDPRVKGWTLYEWNPSPVKGEPIHVENNDIWAISTISTNYRYELSARLVKIDLECTPPLLSVPPQQNCVFLWLGNIDRRWRHKYGGEQCIGATTTIIPPRPSNDAGRTVTPSTSSVVVVSVVVLFHVVILWHP